MRDPLLRLADCASRISLSGASLRTEGLSVSNKGCFDGLLHIEKQFTSAGC
jgi:hypothetical protein